MPDFADRLKALRAEKGATQKNIAALLGINERNYRRYEAGDVDPTASNVSLLADYFGVTTDYLLGRTNYWLDAEGRVLGTAPPSAEG